MIYPYYLSLVLPDKPGQMLKLTEIMAKQKASFNVIKQTGESQGTARISLVTHTMTEAQLNAIKAELKEMPEMQLLVRIKYWRGNVCKRSLYPLAVLIWAPALIP